MRVFELAKQLGTTSKHLIDDLKTMGVTVTNHMAALDEATVAQVLAKDASGPKETKGLKLKEKEEKSAASSAKKKVSARAAVSVKAAAPPELPKAEKKLILVKRRQSETILGSDLQPLQPEEELRPVEIPVSD